MAEPKTASKTAGAFKKGNDPRRGHGKPGRSGRKPITFIAECGRITEEALPKIQRYMRTKGPGDAGFRWAFDKLSSYGKGLPTQKLEVTKGRHEDALEELE